MTEDNLIKQCDMEKIKTEQLEEEDENVNVTVKNEIHYVNVQNDMYPVLKQEFENDVCVKKEKQELFESGRKNEDVFSQTDNYMDILNTNIKIEEEEEIEIKLENESFEIDPASLICEENEYWQNSSELNTNNNYVPLEEGIVSSYKDDLKIKIHKCEYCDYRTNIIGHLNRHIRIHLVTDLEQLKCATCSFVTIHKESLTRHVKRCSFANKHSMKKPRNRPTEKLYKCSVCSFQTNDKWYVTTHTKLMHSPDIPKFKCHICGLETKHKKNLRVHILLHRPDSEKTIYECSECPYQSVHKKCLVKHNRRKHNSIIIKTET